MIGAARPAHNIAMAARRRHRGDNRNASGSCVLFGDKEVAAKGCCPAPGEQG
ncbi:hypothetical protein D9X30_2031 [Cupriavidus sp. U2]|nr:hypothetical protein D9X30_2031 [Cupriavidus sp. U2]